MGIIKELREFVVRGNIIDLAVGIIIGATFGKIASSPVANIIMLSLGLLVSGADFKQFALTLRGTQGDVPVVAMHYGVSIQNVFNFTIAAFTIFMTVELINKLGHKKMGEPATPSAPSKEEVSLSEIRDLLKEQNDRS